MRNSPIIDCLSIAGLLAALAILLSGFWPITPRPNRRLHESIGVALAKQALPLLAPGGQVIIMTRDTDAFRQPALDILLTAFEKEALRASVKIAAIQRTQLDALRPIEVPGGDLYERIRRTPPGHVIVSLLGPPLLSED